MSGSGARTLFNKIFEAVTVYGIESERAKRMREERKRRACVHVCECGYACVCVFVLVSVYVFVCMRSLGRAWFVSYRLWLRLCLLCRCACPAPEQLRIIFVLASLPWNSQPLYDDACCSPAQHSTASQPQVLLDSQFTQRTQNSTESSPSLDLYLHSASSPAYFRSSSHLTLSYCASAAASIPLSLSLDASALSSLMLARALLSCPSLGFHL